MILHQFKKKSITITCEALPLTAVPLFALGK